MRYWLRAAVLVRTHADAVLESKVCHGRSLFPLALEQVEGLLLEGILLEGLLVDILVERGSLVESMLLGKPVPEAEYPFPPQ